jgi:hypothetical protein
MHESLVPTTLEIVDHQPLPSTGTSMTIFCRSANNTSHTIKIRLERPPRSRSFSPPRSRGKEMVLDNRVDKLALDPVESSPIPTPTNLDDLWHAISMLFDDSCLAEALRSVSTRKSASTLKS